MNIVSESNLGRIKSVFNDNSSNTHYYKIIDKTFTGFIDDLEFAKPIIQVNTGHIVWQVKTNGPYLKYATLGKDQKIGVDTLIQDSLNKMFVLLGNDIDQKFLENIIEIPSEDSIFYTLDANNNIKVILTEWGFVKDDHIQGEGVLKKILSTSMKSFILKFKSSKGQLLEGVNVAVTSEGLNTEAKSNALGVVKLNNIKKGNILNVSSLDGRFKGVRLKVETLEEHTIIIEREFTLLFKVIDSNDNPVVGHSFVFNSAVFTNKKVTTDFNGNFSVNHPELDGEFSVLSSEEEELLLTEIPSKNNLYTIIYDPPFTEVPEDEIQPKPEYAIELEFLNWRKKPIINKEIVLYGQNGKSTYVTNNSGLVDVKSLNTGIDYAIFMEFKNTSWKKEFKHTDKNKYTFIVKKKRFLWWWLPLLVFFLLLPLIPTKITHNYTVLDKNTKAPINLADISSSSAIAYVAQSSADKTDSLGLLSIDYGEYSIYSQIFESKLTDVFVQKSGYQSLNAQVPLGYFKTQKSIIYLSKLKPLPPARAIDVGDCNSGGDADNAGGNSIKEFDLKQDRGEFVFTYDTGDTHPDIINIYDCAKSEINKNQPVWSVNEASVINKYVTLKFSSRIITVEVIGGGNIKSMWKYNVQCPK